MNICDDNRLELIERYKKRLVESTNIESSPDEMAVIDNILFRFWQMGWLKEQEPDVNEEAIYHGGDPGSTEIKHEFLREFVVEIPLDADLFNTLISTSCWKVCDYDLDVNALSIKLHFKKCCVEDDTRPSE